MVTNGAGETSAGQAMSAGGGEADKRLAALYERYCAELVRYILAKFGAGPPDPEDVAQSAFEKFASSGKPSEIANPRAFLYAAARNIVIDHHRREAVRRKNAGDLQVAAEQKNHDEITPERVLLEKERYAIFEEALTRMPLRRRKMLLMNRREGLSCPEIAKRFGVSETVVRNQVSLAVRQCLDLLEARLKDGDGKAVETTGETRP